MSNRIRLLFHCDLEGAVAHVGRKALTAMEHLLRNPIEQKKWVPHGEWIKLGRPEFMQRTLKPNLNTGKVGYMYLVSTASVASDVKIPQLGSPIERAKWLWGHLPSEIRKHSRLIVAREARSNCWRRSASNPHRYGWLKPSKKAGVQYIKFKSLEEQPGFDDFAFKEAASVIFGAHGGQKASASLDPSPGEGAPMFKRRPIQTKAPPKFQPVVPEAPKKPKLKVGIWA